MSGKPAASTNASPKRGTTRPSYSHATNIDVGIRRTATGRESPPNVETTKRYAAINAESRSPAARSHEGGLSPTPTPTRGNLLRRKTAVPPDLQPPSGVASCGATLATSRQARTPRHPSYGAIRCAPSRDTPTLQPGNCPAELPRALGVRPALEHSEPARHRMINLPQKVLGNALGLLVRMDAEHRNTGAPDRQTVIIDGELYVITPKRNDNPGQNQLSSYQPSVVISRPSSAAVSGAVVVRQQRQP
uniref:Uncharacterized protein n=1 Tax=Glossina austeni TaxID=7395 RepID=A0A1A9UCS2_GLOAU